jgi:phosphopantothenoylcysteine decarboxylase/phosphopantothenate--cysteine ligase
MGRADDLLTNTVLASTAKKLIVPAMHPKMWLNPATVANVYTLRERGFIVMEPAVGRLTGSDSGIGRFPETSEILNIFFRDLANNRDLEGKKILITLGGTREDIDDVRFIGNRSSGKQGLAIVENAKARGAIVTVINANTSEISGVENISVRSASELQRALDSHFENCDALIMAAAVADARPANSTKGKIKKGNLRSIELEENPDVLTEIASKRKHQILVGFAAESENLQSEAKRKLSAKGVDILYANDIREGAIFGSDMTSGYLVWHEDGKVQEREVTEATKNEIASQLLDIVQSKLN